MIFLFSRNHCFKIPIDTSWNKVVEDSSCCNVWPSYITGKPNNEHRALPFRTGHVSRRIALPWGPEKDGCFKQPAVKTNQPLLDRTGNYLASPWSAEWTPMRGRERGGSQEGSWVLCFFLSLEGEQEYICLCPSRPEITACVSECVCWMRERAR